MNRFLILAVILAVGVLIGRESKEPELIEMLSHEIPGAKPSYQKMRSFQVKIYRECRIFANLDPRSDYDQRVYGTSDYWQDCRRNKLDDGEKGDCEDHALAFKNLMEEEYPLIRVAIYFVWVSVPESDKKSGHAIAVVHHPDGKDFVFDSRLKELREMKQVAHHYTGMREARKQGDRGVFVERANV